MKIPNFFIVGAPKCGTTAMNDYLNQHPDVYMAHKELHYFGNDLQTKNRISEQKYLQHFQNAVNEKIIGEASVWYLFSVTAAKEIKDFSPDGKVLIMLRNPVDVLYSLHSQHLYDGNEDVIDFESALALDYERKAGRNLAKSVDFFKVPFYKDSVLFSNQVQRYLDAFGRQNVHIVLYEDFAKDTEKTVQEVFQFLGIDAGTPIKYNLVNPNKKIKSFYLHQLMKHPPKALKKIVRIVMPARSLRHVIMSFLFKRNITEKKREQMNPQLRSSLKHFFENDVRLLGDLINKDLSAWLR
jgi:hypothetical protein